MEEVKSQNTKSLLSLRNEIILYIFYYVDVDLINILKQIKNKKLFKNVIKDELYCPFEIRFLEKINFSSIWTIFKQECKHPICIFRLSLEELIMAIPKLYTGIQIRKINSDMSILKDIQDGISYLALGFHEVKENKVLCGIGEVYICLFNLYDEYKLLYKIPKDSTPTQLAFNIFVKEEELRIISQDLKTDNGIVINTKGITILTIILDDYHTQPLFKIELFEKENKLFFLFGCIYTLVIADSDTGTIIDSLGFAEIFPTCLVIFNNRHVVFGNNYLCLIDMEERFMSNYRKTQVELCGIEKINEEYALILGYGWDFLLYDELCQTFSRLDFYCEGAEDDLEFILFERTSGILIGVTSEYLFKLRIIK